MHELLDASAVTLARWVRRKKLSPVDLVDVHIARTEAVNPALNAVVAERFDRARAEARALEQRIAASRDPLDLPLLGLPYTAKEYIAAEGMSYTGGIWSRRHVRADSDAETVRRLARAGAILLGISNVPEGGLWMETYNTVHGRTNNPWNLRHTAGGSSGGEGAIVAASGVAFGLGADVGGSIRIPAAFCGCVGHKPTGRMIPNTGFFPEATGELGAYLCCGPLVRRTEDILPIVRALAGPDGVDPVTRTWPIGHCEDIDLRDVTVHPLPGPGGVWVRASMLQALRQAADVLRDAGCTLTEPGRPLRDAFPIWSAMMSLAGGPDYAAVLGGDRPLAPFRELARMALGRSRHTLPAVLVVALEVLTAPLAGRKQQFVAAGKALQAELEALLGDRGVLLFPSYTRPAPRHGAALLTPFDFVCTGLFNVLEFPATAVPLGFTADGLPLSVQVIARRGNDHLSIAVAAALERALGGWRRADPPRA